MKGNKIPFHEDVAQQIIKRLEEKTAPWMKPWKPGEWQAPHNPISGNRYHGINYLMLAMQNYQDTRWMTYNQAKNNGWQVRKGEKSTTIQYWKFSEKRNKLDENNKPIIGENGQPVTETYQLDHPKVFYAKVFNAEQIDGIPPLQAKPITWNAHEKAETIIANSGANIHYDQVDKAFYRSSTDNIHMPIPSSFEHSDAYYATLLHELGHWTGHESRLDRGLGNIFGSEAYAREELRAEISSFMFNSELGLGHDPDQHVAYVGAWIKVLKEDPNEIFRAARDAEKIRDYIIGLQHKQTLQTTTTQIQPIDIATSYLARFHHYTLTEDDKTKLNTDISNGKGPYTAAMHLAKAKRLPLSDEGFIFKSTQVICISHPPKHAEFSSLHLGQSPNTTNPETLRYRLIKQGKESFYTDVDFKHNQAILIGVQGLRQGGDAPNNIRSTSVLAYKEFLRAFDNDYLNRSGLDQIIKAHDRGDRLIKSIAPELITAFQNYHRNSIEGYSILETVNNLSQIAEKTNLKLTVNKNENNAVSAPYIISYQFFDNTETGITSKLYQDGKASIEVNGQRLNDTGLSHDIIWQREALEEAIMTVVNKQQLDQIAFPQNKKIYIDVPYAEKNQAKSLGAKWDRGAKSWYIESNTDLVRFEQWSTTRNIELNGTDTTLKSSLSIPISDSSKRYLAVPYENKEQAKKLGAKWDISAKSWYISSSVDISLVAKWLPHATEDPPALLPAEEFKNTMTAHGFIFETDLPRMDGKLHRVKVEGDKSGQKSGAYVGYLDGKPAGFFENHRTSIKENWKSTGTRLTSAQYQALVAASQQKRRVRETQREATYNHHAKRCQQLWAQLSPTDNNEYLTAKGVDSYDVRQDKKGRLVVPLRDENGTIWSIQRISGNGFKHMKKGAKKSGTFHTLNPKSLHGSHIVLVAEGYSTAATLAKATHLPTVAAIDAGNLPKVASTLKEKHPDKHIVICGDDDRSNPKSNKGRDKAEEAARCVGTIALFPRFLSHHSKTLTDWNDLHQHSNIDTVRSQLLGPLKRLNDKNTLKSNQETMQKAPLKSSKMRLK